MKKLLLFVAASMLGNILPAQAEMTVSTCIQVYQALSNLDGYSKVVKDDKGADKTVTVYYKFGEARFKIAQSLAALRQVSEMAEKARIGLISEIGQGKAIEQNSAEMSKLSAEYSKVLEGKCSVEIGKLSLSGLNLGDEEGKNPIPPSVLSVLMPIIDPSK